MPQYFNLHKPRHFDPGNQWLLRFPSILRDDFDLDSPNLLQDRWNSRTFAFAGNSKLQSMEEKPDFPFIFGEWHGASARLVATLTELAPDAFEFLGFRTRTTIGGDVTDNYSILHYLKWNDAVDKKCSQLHSNQKRFVRRKEFGGDFDLDHVVLARRKLVHPICRVVGWSPYHLYRDDVIEVLHTKGFTGLAFEEVELT